MSPEEVYALAQKHCGLNFDDRVRITRTASDHEAGWVNTWNHQIDDLVGAEGKIVESDKTAGIYVQLEDDSIWLLPFFILEKVNIDCKQECSGLACFDKVIVRDCDDEWYIDLFGKYDKEAGTFKTLTGEWNQCLPYDKYSHLYDTTDDIY